MGMETNEQPHATVKPTMYPRVIVVGNLTIDDVVLPDGTTRMSSVGGNSLYTLLGARLWQSQVGVVTRRGEDFPRDLTEMLNVRGEARRRFFSAKNLIRDPNRIRTGNPNERDRAFTSRSGDGRDRLACDDRFLLCRQICRSFSRISFRTAMHFRFCSIVPTEMRIHSGN